MKIKTLIVPIAILLLSICGCSDTPKDFYTNAFLSDIGIEDFPRMESKNVIVKDGDVKYECTQSEYIDYCSEIISYLTARDNIYYFGYTERIDISDGGTAGIFQTYSLFSIDNYNVNDSINCFAYSLHSELSNTGNHDYNLNNLIEPVSISLSYNSENQLVLAIKQSVRVSYQWTGIE